MDFLGPGTILDRSGPKNAAQVAFYISIWRVMLQKTASGHFSENGSLIPPYSPFVGWLPIPRCGPSPIPGQAKMKLLGRARPIFFCLAWPGQKKSLGRVPGSRARDRVPRPEAHAFFFGLGRPGKQQNGLARLQFTNPSPDIILYIISGPRTIQYII